MVIVQWPSSPGQASVSTPRIRSGNTDNTDSTEPGQSFYWEGNLITPLLVNKNTMEAWAAYHHNVHNIENINF